MERDRAWRREVKKNKKDEDGKKKSIPRPRIQDHEEYEELENYKDKISKFTRITSLQ